MALTVNERAARHRAKIRGENIVELKRGPKRGYKQTKEHVEKRKRRGTEHHAWIGDSASIKSGRCRAERIFDIQPCEMCGESAKRIDRHHKDGDTRNNERSNIKFLCRRCHMREDGRTEKLIDLAKRNQPKAVAARWR